MVIVDSPSHIARAGSRRDVGGEGPFRVDPSAAVARPPGVTFCAERESVLESLASLGRRRGEILGGLNPRASEAETKHIRERVERLDASISRLMENGAELVKNDPAFRAVCVSVARSSENSARFLALAETFYGQGINQGEAQGRVVHDERLRGVETNRIKLAVSLERFHSSGFLAPRSDAEGARKGLHEVLDAARELGKREGVVSCLQADLLASRVYRAIGGWRTYIPSRLVKDASAVHSALDGLSKAEAGLVQQAYQALTGSDLKSDLVKAFEPNHAASFILNLHAHDTGAAMIALRRELEHPLRPLGFRGEAIRSLYENLTKREIEEIESSLTRSECLGRNSVQKHVASSVTYAVAKEIAAYRDGDRERADVVRLDRKLRSFFGRAEVVTVLGGIAPERLGAFEERYKEVTGRGLREQLGKYFKDSPRLDLCNAILDRDERRVAAAEVACSLVYRKDFIAAHFLGLESKERERLVSGYEALCRERASKAKPSVLTGDFQVDLRNSVWKEDYLFLSAFPGLCRYLDRVWWPTTGSLPFVESVVRNGKLAPAELLRYFMVGIGTDVEGIYAVLSNRSQSNIRAIEEDYATRYPPGSVVRFLGRLPFIKNFVLTGNLRHDLNVELSGDSEFDVQQMLRGFRDNSSAKQLCAHIYSTLVLRERHETSGILAKWSRLAAMRGDSVIKRRYDEDFAAADGYFKKHIASSKNPSPECVVRFLTLARLTDIHANSFRETKNLLGEVFLNSGAFVGVVLGTSAVLALATFSYPIVATASFLGSLAWRLTVGRCVLGRGFGRGEVMFQSARAFIDGVSIFTVRVGVATLGQFIGGQLSKSAAKGGFKTGFNKMIKSMENRVRRQDKARHVLEKSSVINSNEDLRATVSDFTKALGDRHWPIGQGALEIYPAIESLLQERTEHD
jgi:hypothetical protein